jgi:hypothetical protein
MSFAGIRALSVTNSFKQRYDHFIGDDFFAAVDGTCFVEDRT